MLATWGPQIKPLVNGSLFPHSLTTNLEFYCFIIILLWVERIEVANWGAFPFLEFSLPEAICSCLVWMGAP